MLWLLGSHPATAAMLASIGLFPNRKKANKRLHRLVERKRLRLLGTVSLKGGRPENVYGRGRWKGDNLVHEVQLTRACLRIDADEIRRGPGYVDAFLRPDAELWIAGRRFLLEMDCGSMSYADVVRKRFNRYRTTTDLVLWVCPSPSRLEGLRRNAEVIRSTALFATIEQVLLNPHAPIWVDCDGVRAALPHSRDRGDNGGDEAGDNAGIPPHPDAGFRLLSP